MTKEFGESSFNNLYYRYKRSAIKRGYKFDIDKESFYKFTQQNCYYCGIEPLQIHTQKHYVGFFNYNGIDRIDNKLGYVFGNIVTCCKYCNMAKHTRTVKEFYNWIEKVYERMNEMTTDNLFGFKIDESLLPKVTEKENLTEESKKHLLDTESTQWVENGYVNYMRIDGSVVGRPTSTPNTLNHNDMTDLIDELHKEIQETRKNGASEYANSNTNCFGNFDRLSDTLGMTSEQVLLVYLTKHMDGINSYVKGHKSQRESVKGRIIDAIVYLMLLYGMVLRQEKWTIGESITKGWKD